jgi:hypothetical protein
VTNIQKAIAGLIGVMMITTMVLPGRQTPEVIEKLFGGASKLSKTVIGQG